MGGGVGHGGHSMSVLWQTVFHLSYVDATGMQCRMVCGHSKRAVSFCLYLCIAASKGRDATWCVGFKFVGSVQQKLWRSLDRKFQVDSF